MRQTSSVVVSAWRATSIVDTPMRKLEILEAHDGTLVLRATEYREGRADVRSIYLAHHESQALAKALFNLEDQGETIIDRARAQAGD